MSFPTNSVPVPIGAGDRAPARADAVSRGMGVAARAAGLTTDVYRTVDATTPLALERRLVRLHTVMADARGRFTPDGYGEALWQGYFDTAYTAPGDYLVRADGVWFIASQPPLMPPLCVRTNRTVSLLRPDAPAIAGVASYGGVSGPALALASDWPAAVHQAGFAGRPSARLPDDVRLPLWQVLLPTVPGVVPRPSDEMQDDLGRRAVVASAELSELGWRLVAREAVT